VSLASDAAIFPRVTRFNYGDAYPSNPLFVSGSGILWGFGFGPADGDFYSAMMLGTFSTGPGYVGWMHMLVENSATFNPTITVIDWAYSNQVGESIFMGQTPAPEPSSIVLFGSALLALAAAAGLKRFSVRSDSTDRSSSSSG